MIHGQTRLVLMKVLKRLSEWLALVTQLDHFKLNSSVICSGSLVELLFLFL